MRHVWMGCLVLVTGLGWAAEVPEVQLRQDFEALGQESGWTGWALNQEVAIRRASPGFESEHCLSFTVSQADWDTAILEFKPAIRVTPRTVLRFRMKYAPGTIEGINVRDATEEAEYLISFMAHPDEWLLVQRYLGRADYKRNGRADTPRDGVAGDEVSSIQIAYWGSELLIDDVEVFEATEDLKESPVLELPIVGPYTPKHYAILDEVCPFGVISTVGAGDSRNAELFGQTKREREEDDLLDLSRHSMNAVANFCDDGEVASRLAMYEKYRMYLVETVLANASFRDAKPDDPLLQLVDQVKDHPRLLAWYGRDEPQNYGAYLGDKLAIMGRDPGHPVASAFNLPQAVKVLGPYMEVMMLDSYSLHDEVRSVDKIAFHGDLIRQARASCAGGRVWLIPQSFGGRNRETFVYRMPDPSEARFEVYNALAAGATGFLWFIYNDTCPFLDGAIRGEEFDDTLVDAWGNPSPTYEEISELARRLTPVLPEMVGVKDAEPALVTDAPRDRLTVGQLVNDRGTWLVLANRDLAQPFQGRVTVAAAAGAEGVYDAEALTEVGLEAGGGLALDLPPGGGRVLLVTSPEKWVSVRERIVRRGLLREVERLEVELGVLQAAGLDCVAAGQAVAAARAQAGNPEAGTAAVRAAWAAVSEAEQQSVRYVQTRQGLQSVQEGFGAIRERIRPVVVATEKRTDAEWLALRGELLEASRRYFALQRDWKAGVAAQPGELAALGAQVESLRLRVAGTVGG